MITIIIVIIIFSQISTHVLNVPPYLNYSSRSFEHTSHHKYSTYNYISPYILYMQLDMYLLTRAATPPNIVFTLDTTTVLSAVLYNFSFSSHCILTLSIILIPHTSPLTCFITLPIVINLHCSNFFVSGHTLHSPSTSHFQILTSKLIFKVIPLQFLYRFDLHIPSTSAF